jgi:hypothetical protein
MFGPEEALNQFNETPGRVGLVGADELLPKALHRGHKSAKFAVIVSEFEVSFRS